MQVKRTIAIARNDARIARQDYFAGVILVFFPLFAMVLGKRLYQPTLMFEGLERPSGAEQAVPGMSVTFGFLFVGAVSYTFFREQAWNTWDRLRGSPVLLSEVVMGKAACILCQGLLQLAIVFGGGALLTGLEVRGPWIVIAAIGIAFYLFVISVGLAVTAFSKSLLQASTIAYLVVLVLSFEAGAIVPPSILPGWAQALAPLTPGYWTMEAFRQAISGSMGSVSLSISGLLILAILLYLLSLRRMRLTEDKVGL